MQLLILLMLALMGGNAGALKEVTPILESFGGAEAKKALDKAEELSGVISALQAMSGSMSGATRARQSHSGHGGEKCENEFAQHGFPLAPITNIADENIIFCLSRYIAAGQ